MTSQTHSLAAAAGWCSRHVHAITCTRNEVIGSISTQWQHNNTRLHCSRGWAPARTRCFTAPPHSTPSVLMLISALMCRSLASIIMFDTKRSNRQRTQRLQWCWCLHCYSKLHLNFLDTWRHHDYAGIEKVINSARCSYTLVHMYTSSRESCIHSNSYSTHPILLSQHNVHTQACFDGVSDEKNSEILNFWGHMKMMKYFYWMLDANPIHGNLGMPWEWESRIMRCGNSWNFEIQEIYYLDGIWSKFANFFIWIWSLGSWIP